MAKKKGVQDKKTEQKKEEQKNNKEREEEETSTPVNPPEDTGQPPPPDLGDSGGEFPWDHDHEHEHDKKHKHDDHDDKHHHDHFEHEVAEVIYRQLLEVRKTVDALAQETKDAKLRKRLERVPVRTSDLMRGFQAAVARANNSARSGEEDGEDIERMSIKDLEISLTAPIIEGGHADDPVLMLPNIKSAESETAAVSLKFTVVSVPLKQRG